jgi:hypothetical protein
MFIHNAHITFIISSEFELLLLVKPQFTTNALNVPHFSQCSHGHFWSCTVAVCQRTRIGSEWFDRHQECVGEVPVHFNLELIHQGFLSVPTDENQTDWGREQVGSYTSKNTYLRANIDTKRFYVFCCGEFIFEFLRNLLDSLYINVD